MRIVVNDASCLIDLRKAGLLHSALLLPFTFQVAYPLVYSRDAELRDFTAAEMADLAIRGLQIVDLPPEGVGRALTMRSVHPSLSFNDCASIVLAESQEDAVLLTGDRQMRLQAAAVGIEVHGVLWVADQLHASNHIAFEALHEALVALREDPLVFLPQEELATRIDALRVLLGLPNVGD